MLPVCASYCGNDEDKKMVIHPKLGFCLSNPSQQNLCNVEIGLQKLEQQIEVEKSNFLHILHPKYLIGSLI